ncbi:MAG: hypothetical protein GXO92_01155 [FCB group bacterium]|nr:hypothetical protein [FCB group bacterium]
MKNFPLTQRARENEGVVFTPDNHALVMVTEALYCRLHADIPHLDRNSYDIFIMGNAPLDVGRALVRFLLEYIYLDPAVGEGIFLRTLWERIKCLAGRYDVSIPEKWLSSNVFGYDISSDMVRKCRSRFSEPPRLKVGDYLLAKNAIVPDIIIANPPYIRQELLRGDYKAMVREHFQNRWEDLAISARADLYVYFLLKAAQDLNPKGAMTFIIPNSWMDNDYGQAVRDLFRHHLQVYSIAESDQRHFKADINTVIVSAVNKPPAPQTEIYLSRGESRRFITQRELEEMDLGWYGSLFRCPAWLLSELKSNKNLLPLGKIFQVKTGIITGDNHSYYQTENLDGTYHPAIRSPREAAEIAFDAKDAGSWVKVENVPYQIRRAPLLWTDLRGGRHLVVWNRDNLPFEHTFYGLTPHSHGDIKALALLLNSSWVWLMVEIFGRKGLGGGAIRMVKKDLMKIHLPDPEGLEFPESVETLLRRPIGSWQTELRQPDRISLDAVVFEALSLRHRYDECMDLLRSLMALRARKAGPIGEASPKTSESTRS